MMTFDETIIFDNMTYVIKNLEQSKSIRDIIDDLNKLILTLRGRNHDITDEPESVKMVTVTVATPVQIKTDTVTKAETKDKTMTKAEPVQKQTKAETKDKTVTKKKTDSDAKALGRVKVECRCGLMICSAAMSRHEKGTKHNEAMTKKEKTELKQAEGQTLGVNDMDLVDIETYMKVMLPHLYKKVRGLVDNQMMMKHLDL